MAKITLIMPAYNAEAWLAESIRSVLEQSFRDFTLLAVDDGATDQTPAILDALAAEDPRVRPIHTVNGGPAKARNLALEQLDADTEYVMFLDSDDHLLPDALEYALQGAAQGAELTIFGFTIEELGGGTRDYCEPAALLDRESLGASLEHGVLTMMEMGYGTTLMTSQNWCHGAIETLVEKELGFSREGWFLGAMFPIGVPLGEGKSPGRKPLEDLVDFFN